MKEMDRNIQSSWLTKGDQDLGNKNDDLGGK